MENTSMAGGVLGDRSQGRLNNFDFLRFVAASIVIFSHAYAVAGPYGSLEPLGVWSHHTMSFGGLAVRTFFVISGFLITASYLNRRSFRKFWRARLFRIMPGLIAAVAVSIFVIGPIATSLPLRDYFARVQTYAYFQTILLLPVNVLPWKGLPGVFSHNPLPNEVNGSLWTLMPEMMCYLLVSLMGQWGLLRKWTSVLLFASTLAIYCLVSSGHLNLRLLLMFAQHLELLVSFAAGMAFYLYRDRVPLRGSLAAASLVALVIANHFVLLTYVFPIFGGYLILYLAYCGWLRCTGFAKNGDFSYGIYIYAFPIQQLVTHLAGDRTSVWMNCMLSFPITLAMASLSWHLVEKRFIRMKSLSMKGILGRA